MCQLVFASRELYHLLNLKLSCPVDQEFDSLRSVPLIQRRCLHYLSKICGHQALIPKVLEISTCCYDPEEPPQCHGGFGDVWKGIHKGKEVACKVLKVYETSDHEQIRRMGCFLTHHLH